MIIILNLIFSNGFEIVVLFVFFFLFSLFAGETEMVENLNSLEESIMTNLRIVILVVDNRICCLL